jgi:hypothetical protein
MTLFSITQQILDLDLIKDLLNDKYSLREI